MTAELIWNAEDLIRAVHGQCLHEQSWQARGICTDIRKLRGGDVFIALQAQFYDGHNDVAAAFEAGAVAAIVSRPPHISPDAPLVHVADTSRALEDLARVARTRAHGRILAVSASMGGTACKKMLHLMLNEVGDTYGCEDGLDDHRGIPLALARLPETALYGVFETGGGFTGKPEGVAWHMQPHITLVPGAPPMQSAWFAHHEPGAEIFSGMMPDGTVVLNRDAPQFALLAAAAKVRGIRKILGFGQHAKSDARLLGYTETIGGGEIHADILGRKIRYNLTVPGMQAALDSIAALCAARAAGADLYACAAALAWYRAPRDRSVIDTLELSGGEFSLIADIGDTHAADLRFAVRVLGEMTPQWRGQRIMVLGDIPVYDGLAQEIVEANIHAVFCCGATTAELFQALPPSLHGLHAPNAAELAPHILRAIEPGDIVSVKGTQLDAAVEALKHLELPLSYQKRSA